MTARRLGTDSRAPIGAQASDRRRRDTEDTSRRFRVIPQQAWAVENNLRLANMGFDDFEAALGPDGVFRGI